MAPIAPAALSAAFCAHLPETAAPGWSPSPATEERLQALYDTASAAWPGVDLAAEVFLRHLAQHASKEDDPDRALAAVHAPDLYLACACAEGSSAAYQLFERRYLIQVPVFLARLNPSPDLADEVTQLLREKLLVEVAGSRPRIADYAGRGTLQSWLRVVALRTAVSILRKQGKLLPYDEEVDERALVHGPDPEREFIKGRYGEAFKAAFLDALATLSAEQRNLLRLYYVDELTIGQLGALLRTSNATICRRLAAAREAVRAETERLLRQRLQLNSLEYASLVGLLQSGLDLSLATYLSEG